MALPLQKREERHSAPIRRHLFISLITPYDLRVLAVSCGVLLLGLAAMLDHRGNSPLLGALTALGGLAGIGWTARRVWQRQREEREAQQAEAARAAKREARRGRILQARATRTARRLQAETALAQQRRAQSELRVRQRRVAEEENARQNAREAEITAETARLLALSEAEMAEEVAAIFSRRGYMVTMPDPDAPCDLLLTTSESGVREVLRCVPPEKRARSVDVQALEAWRASEDAKRAFLIAVAGFSPAAIRLAQTLPLTLVEAHLLAHWKHSLSDRR